MIFLSINILMALVQQSSVKHTYTHKWCISSFISIPCGLRVSQRVITCALINTHTEKNHQGCVVNCFQSHSGFHWGSKIVSSLSELDKQREDWDGGQLLIQRDCIAMLCVIMWLSVVLDCIQLLKGVNVFVSHLHTH